MRRLLLWSLLVAVLAWSGLASAGTATPPPPTPFPRFGSPVPFPTALDTPPPSQQPPRVHAAAAILEDLGTGQVLYRLHPDDRRPIASLTKVMTAVMVLQRDGLGDPVKVHRDAAELGSHDVGLSELGLQDGERLSVRHLLYALLLQSANDVAVALADHVSGTAGKFVALMNREAATLGLTRTRFFSPNGLDDRGHSTARSLAALARVAERIPAFARIVRTKFHVVPAPAGQPARHIQNRNVLLWLYPGAIGVKTGFTTKAGYCLIAAARLNGARMVAVVLDDPTSQGSFSDAAALLNFGFHAFVPSEVVRKGRGLGAVRVDGLRVPVAAGASLSAWVPAENVAAPTFEIRTRGAGASPRVGQTAGVATVSLHGLVLGRVPVIVSGPPRAVPGSAPPLPLWRRALDAVNRAADGVFHAVFG